MCLIITDDDKNNFKRLLPFHLVNGKFDRMKILHKNHFEMQMTQSFININITPVKRELKKCYVLFLKSEHYLSTRRDLLLGIIVTSASYYSFKLI